MQHAAHMVTYVTFHADRIAGSHSGADRIAREIANEYALLSGKSRVVNATYRHLMKHELEVFEIEHMQDVLRQGKIAMARCRYFTPKGRERHVLVCVADLEVA